MMTGSLLVLRQLDHVLTAGLKCHHDLTIPAQAVDLEKHLIPGELGETGRQSVQLTPVRAFDRSQNAIGHRMWRSHDQLLLLTIGSPLRSNGDRVLLVTNLA
jgi:hypothetical protein